MDPYLEGHHWPDFHQEFVGAWRAALLDRLPVEYDARIREREVVIRPELRDRSIYPNVSVVTSGTKSPSASPDSSAGSTLAIAPVRLETPLPEVTTEVFIEIVTSADEKLVAVLELLSPSNKRGDSRTIYLQKRRQVVQSEAHLVEVDLLLGGQRLPVIGKLPNGDYYAFVSRADESPACDVYAWDLPHVLPDIPIPLLNPGEQVTVNLSSVFAEAYRRGAYPRRLRYNRPPEAPIPPAAVEWVQTVVSAVH